MYPLVGHDRFMTTGCYPKAIMLPDLFVCFSLGDIWIELKFVYLKH